MKIAIAQLNPTIGDLIGNSQLILEAAQQAIAQSANLMITPELSLIGYPPRDLLVYPGFIEAVEKQLAKLARLLPPELAVLVGTVMPNPDAVSQGEKPLFNSAALLQNGLVQKTFHKRLLPTYDVFDEDRYFAPGKTSDYFIIDQDTFFIKIGVTICEDIWNDEEFWQKRSYNCNPVQDLVNQEVNLIVNLSASPYRVKKQRLRENMLSYTVNRYHIPIVYVNQVGGNDDLIFDGASVAFNHRGEAVFRADSFQADLKIFDFDEIKCDLISREENTPADLANVAVTEDAEIWSALVLGVKDYVRKCGFSKVVLGLSGGIDSALVAAIASFAVGAENVLGVLMPSPYSSEHSVTDSLALAENLGIKTETIPIGNLMTNYDQALANIFANTSFGIAEENIQSRIRGNLLMAIANKYGHLLLSTGNKSEMAVGYCTLYGDMNGGLAVIADVPKMRVYSLCEWLNHQSNQQIIPTNILTKPPSAELKPGQVDQDSLPEYAILDDILARFIEQSESPAQIIASGHDQKIVERVIKLVMQAEFKRRQAPPGLKISDRAFGTGWRMPIAKSGFQEVLITEDK
ncbi:MAG: NAD+ synthase [Microcoleaceae cyanobacterium]